jgi:hypothetical protein
MYFYLPNGGMYEHVEQTHNNSPNKNITEENVGLHIKCITPVPHSKDGIKSMSQRVHLMSEQ